LFAPTAWSPKLAVVLALFTPICSSAHINLQKFYGELTSVQKSVSSGLFCFANCLGHRLLYFASIPKVLFPGIVCKFELQLTVSLSFQKGLGASTRHGTMM
jgi:hypothetical protein